MAVQLGRAMPCPHCRKQFQVGQPEQSSARAVVGSVFTFRCSLCNSRLEAYTGMIGRKGQCPTCAAEFSVPQPTERAARTGGTEVESEYAQPVHAFAASGDKAPKIVRLANGQQVIQCPRCKASNAVDRNNCRTCAAPFTLEATEGKTPGGGLAVTSLVMGIVGIFLSFVLIVSLLAIVFGVLALREQDTAERPSRGGAIAGLVLGIVGLLIGCLILLRSFLP